MPDAVREDRPFDHVVNPIINNGGEGRSMDMWTGGQADLWICGFVDLWIFFFLRSYEKLPLTTIHHTLAMLVLVTCRRIAPYLVQ